MRFLSAAPLTVGGRSAPSQGQSHRPDLWVASPSPFASELPPPHVPAASLTPVKSILGIKCLSEVTKEVSALLTEHRNAYLGLRDGPTKMGLWGWFTEMTALAKQLLKLSPAVTWM